MRRSNNVQKDCVRHRRRLALAYPATALTADEEVAALKQLPWVGTGIYTLPISGSKLALPKAISRFSAPTRSVPISCSGTRSSAVSLRPS